MKKLYKITLFFTILCSAVTVFAQTGDREKGVELYNQGEYQKAVAMLRKAVETDKNDKKSWLYLGMSQARLNNRSEAETALIKADKISVEEKEADKTQTKLIITSKPRPNYTDSARTNQTQGTVKVAVEFGADGQVKEIFPFQTLPDGLTESCVKAVKKVKFEPATKDGTAFSTIGILSYQFTIY